MGSSSSNSNCVHGVMLKVLLLVGGGGLVLKTLRKSTKRRDHALAVAQALNGDKVSREQALRDPNAYLNIRMVTCPAEMVDGSRVLYFEEAFSRTPNKPFRQRFLMVKPCPNEMKCDVELSSFAISDVEEYKNFCDRPKDQKLQSKELIGDIAEHLSSVYLSQCEGGKRCLYEGSTKPAGFPNSWHGAMFGTSEIAIHRNGEIHYWDRGFDDKGNQVWGPKNGPYEFKPVTPFSHD